MVSARHEFPTAWHRFLHPAAAATSQEITFALGKQHFPFMFSDRPLDIQELTVVLLLEEPAVYSTGDDLPATVTHPGGSHADDLMLSSTVGGQPALSVATGFTVEQEPKEIVIKIDETDLSGLAAALIEERDGKKRLNADQIKDMVVLVKYAAAG